jgi:predicted enzyme related to lactoylglutathione lyase
VSRYVEIPAPDYDRAIAFYTAVFDWNVRRRGDGTPVFEDKEHELSGAWVHRSPSADRTHTLVDVMVIDAPATLVKAANHGGEILETLGDEAPELIGRFKDPDGNVIGVCQET